MAYLDPQSPESPTSQSEQTDNSPGSSREILASQQKNENAQAGRENAKDKSNIVDSSASSRADLMSSIQPSTSQDKATNAPGEIDQAIATLPPDLQEKATSISDKFKDFFGKINEKLTAFFFNIFNIKSKSSDSTTTEKPIAKSNSATAAPKPTPSTENLQKLDPEMADDGTQGLKGEALLSNEKFKTRTTQIAEKIGCSTDDLYAIFKMESGANPQAVNTVSKATGLIQWMPKYAPQYGTTTAELSKMTGLQQLDYVEKFFSRYFGKLHTFSDLYRAVFWPAAIGKGPDYVFQTSSLSAELVAKQNPGIAKATGRPDGYIDNAGFEKYANKFKPKPPNLA